MRSGLFPSFKLLVRETETSAIVPSILTVLLSLQSAGGGATEFVLIMCLHPALGIQNNPARFRCRVQCHIKRMVASRQTADAAEDGRQSHTSTEAARIKTNMTSRSRIVECQHPQSGRSEGASGARRIQYC